MEAGIHEIVGKVVECKIAVPKDQKVQQNLLPKDSMSFASHDLSLN